jgi:hypothetical protein
MEKENMMAEQGIREVDSSKVAQELVRRSMVGM